MSETTKPRIPQTAAPAVPTDNGEKPAEKKEQTLAEIIREHGQTVDEMEKLFLKLPGQFRRIVAESFKLAVTRKRK